MPEHPTPHNHDNPIIFKPSVEAASAISTHKVETLRTPEEIHLASDSFVDHYLTAYNHLVDLVLAANPTFTQESDIDVATLEKLVRIAEDSAIRSIELEMARTEATELSKKVQGIEVKASIDHLTGIYNRAGFDKTFSSALEEAQIFATEQNSERTHENRLVHVFVHFDIDKFKIINDFGLAEHEEGDNVLQSVGEALRKDIRPTDLIARFGGDEFGILFLNVPANEIDHVMQRVIDSLEAITYRRKDDPVAPVHIGVSAGVRIIESSEQANLETIKNDADKTAGLAKLGKDGQSYLIHDPDARKKVAEFLQAELGKPIIETSTYKSLLRENQRYIQDLRTNVSSAAADRHIERLKETASDQLQLQVAKARKALDELN